MVFFPQNMLFPISEEYRCILYIHTPFSTQTQNHSLHSSVLLPLLNLPHLHFAQHTERVHTVSNCNQIGTESLQSSNSPLMRYYARKAFPKVQSKKYARKPRKMEYPMTEGELQILKQEITMVSVSEQKQKLFIQEATMQRNTVLCISEKIIYLQSHTL